MKAIPGTPGDMLECRANQNFYHSPVYENIRQYAALIRGVLDQGIKSGEFRDDVTMYLVRDLIFGTIDFETVSLLGTGEVESITADLEDIMVMIRAMIQRKEAPGISPDNKAERILRAAEKVFAAKGFNKARMSEIAREAGVAEGTIYEYFTNKEDLILAIPTTRIKQYLTKIPGLFEIQSPTRKLRRFIRHHFSLFMAERTYLKVFCQVQLSRLFYESQAYKEFIPYFQVIENIIEEGRRAGVSGRRSTPGFFGTCLWALSATC